MRQGYRVLALVIFTHCLHVYTVDFPLTSVLCTPRIYPICRLILEVNGVSGVRMEMTEGLLLFGWLGFENGTQVAQTGLELAL